MARKPAQPTVFLGEDEQIESDGDQGRVSMRAHVIHRSSGTMMNNPIVETERRGAYDGMDRQYPTWLNGLGKLRAMGSGNADLPDGSNPSGQTIHVPRRTTLSRVGARCDRPRLVVFDFDNTLYAGTAGTRLLIWLIFRSWWRVIAGALISPVIAPLWLCAETRPRAIAYSTYLWIGTVGARYGEMSPVVDRYVATALGRLRSRLRHQGTDALTTYQRAGDQVVVVTGTPLELVRTVLASELGDSVSVVGSTSRRFMGGLIVDQYCYGAQKLPMLYDAGYTAPLVIAYGDSTADLPLLARAVKPIVVNPRASHIAAFRHVLGVDVEIQTWG